MIAVDNDSPEIYRKLDIPVCCATMGMMLGGFSERDELEIAEVCRKMAKTVYVDAANKTLFIGEDPAVEETGLVVYTEKKDSDMSNSFFRRWTDTRHLMFEYQVKGLKGDLFVIKGLWIVDHWHALDIFPSSRLHVIQPERDSKL